MERRSFALRWGWLLALWLVMAGTVSVGEVLAGVVAATVGAVVWAAVLRCVDSIEALLPSSSWGSQAGDGPSPWRVARWSRVPWRVLVDVWVVTRVLVWRVLGRPVRSSLQRVPFEAGSPARAILAVVALSLPPNSYVVDVDADEGMLVVHQLDPHAAGGYSVLRP